MSPRVCVVCGKQDSLTRDHVVARLVLRMMLGREQYSKFCSFTRKNNLQPTCSECNNMKGHRVTDLRTPGDHKILLEHLELFNILDLVEFEDPYDVFGDLVEKGPKLWLR